MGQSGCGKSTLEKELCKAYPAVFKKVVSFVTRPKRDGEIDGQDYHFLTHEEVDNTHPFQSTVFNHHVYGTMLREYTTPHSHLTFVITPNAAAETIPKLKEQFPGIKILLIYFDISLPVLCRNMDSRGDSKEMIAHRLLNDDLKQQFIDRELVADYVVTDNTLDTWLSMDVLRWLKVVNLDSL